MKKYYTHITLFFIVAILITASVLTYRNLTNYIEVVAWTRHSNTVLRTVEMTFSLVKDVETGHRGFQLTKDSTFLQPYYKSFQTIPKTMRILDSLVADNPEQVERVKNLKVMVDSQFMLISNHIENKSTYSKNNGREKNMLLHSKFNMDAMRLKTKEIADAEMAILNSRVTKDDEFRAIAPIAILSYALVALMAVVLLFYRILMDLRAREKGERQLAQSNIALKKEVAMREMNEKQLENSLMLREQAEKHLIESERLSMTGKMARTVAHEVRNPLTNLNLALEHLKDEMPADDEGINLYTDIMQRNINRIEHLIGEMLNSSQPKELRLELIPINELLDETISLAIDRIKLKEIKLEKRYAHGLRAILIDKEKIKIALLNIIINATEAMAEGEGLLIITCSEADHIITISISDNGKGIAPEEMDQLFEPFFTAKPGGLGLGLTSTKTILNSHHADIHVISEQRKGTTFSILFRLPS